ncbi:IQ domain-containing protein/TIG domain-containing protein/CG-1 domain-containing protein/Ank_2 domain-containing protein [Cephalotus follicularis]|uniref:IQ domain-containing protein/TIG domain-containing protein/CG-1 domain-containing protein/Ank_2 domain-containing protein n=1 Tax=Cephalotus follicularis TaxID=3775 RepID=A0A1Q3BBE2_CEPFO|nr:IQ domain-containing protein/TIG domain-containing protein/CG-1 domain-containing protein/Ank_2 domain-containing protein [Cephalotus follicularis]
MADPGSYGLAPRLDFEQLLSEAQHRWLRPAEICQLLCNYKKFRIASEPPNRPPSGSLFLFDRKALRYFRKDGHNWRKKRDGKTVREAHEKLKVGSVDVLHCYYAHGEDNESFQRRSYWMLEQDMMHIVFVHYLEVKGNRTKFEGDRANEVTSGIQTSSPLAFSFSTNQTKAPSGITDSTSPTSTLTSLCEDADSGDSHQTSYRFYSSTELLHVGKSLVREKMDSDPLCSYLVQPSSENHIYQSSIPGVNHVSHAQSGTAKDSDDGNLIIESQRTLGLGSWEEVLEQCTVGHDNATFFSSLNSTQPTTAGIMLKKLSMIEGELLAGDNDAKEKFESPQEIQLNRQIPCEDNLLDFPKSYMVPSSNLELSYNLGTVFFEQGTKDQYLQNSLEPFSTYFEQHSQQALQNNLQIQPSDAEFQYVKEANSDKDMRVEGNIKYSLSVKKALLDGVEGLKKVDSFSLWASKELGEVDNLDMQSSSGIPWSTVEGGNVADDSSLSPYLTQDQHYSIIDFSPKWAYTDSETEVLITGTFLKSQQDVVKCDWSCMFGEVEVPAEVLADGILCCHAPPHNVGQVPFYVTCSNRLACSEVREFDYLVGPTKDIDISDIYGGHASEMFLHMQLERLLSLRSFSSSNHLLEDARGKHNLICKIISLKEEEERCHVVESTSEKDFSLPDVKKQLLQKLMKEKLYSWLLRKVTEDGKGPNVIDDKGQGVLHLAAALGYDWAIKPTVTAGVSINFRDVNGWTALHWAAFCGREETVCVLVSLHADPGALTDPSPDFPSGRTAADLASGNGHKGISGFLAESSLTSYLASLTMTEPKEDGSSEVSETRAVQTVSERTATPGNNGDGPDVLSLKDSLTAICNATQAADRIYQVFRMQSFQRKQFIECGNDEFGMSDKRALSLIGGKICKSVRHNGLAHSAAVQIQKKFRGWKKRKEFLLIRQRIVKIQAHVRGHQVRKQYKTFIWSVGILEKIVLRWRRKGSGLRGFRRDSLMKGSDQQCLSSKEDDYDFLKEGRKQTEERYQKALTRVKSMVQYPEGRSQYRRLLTVVEGFRKAKESDMVWNSAEETADADEELIDIDSLLDDDAFMSIAFE